LVGIVNAKQKAVASARKCTVAIISRTFDLKTGEARKPIVGSGVIVGDGLILTCVHVLRVQPHEVRWERYEVLPDDSFDPMKDFHPTVVAEVAWTDDDRALVTGEE